MATKKTQKSSSKRPALRDLKPSKDAKGGAQHAQVSRAFKPQPERVRQRVLN